MPEPTSSPSKRTTVVIPQVFHDIRNRIEELTLPLAHSVQDRFPDSRFGLRVLAEMNELADKATLIAALEGLNERQAGMLMVSARAHDIGRHIAADRELGPKGQHNHGALSCEFLTEHHLLKSLPEDEQKIILEIVANHSLREINLPLGSVSRRICQLFQDLDRIKTCRRAGFTEAKGAIHQFLEWGRGDLDREGTRRVLGAEDISTMIAPFLVSLFSGDPDGQTRNLTLLQSFANDPTSDIAGEVVRRFSSWFTAPVRPELLARVGAWLEDRSATPPSFSKDEMIENYSSYMLAQLIIALRINTNYVWQELTQDNAFIDRLNVLSASLSLDDYEHFIGPIGNDLFDKLAASSNPPAKH